MGLLEVGLIKTRLGGREREIARSPSPSPSPGICQRDMIVRAKYAQTINVGR